MIDKTYRTVAQLIDILRSRGMVIENEQASSGRHTLFIGVWLYSLMGLGERPDLWQGHDVL